MGHSSTHKARFNACICRPEAHADAKACLRYLGVELEDALSIAEKIDL